MYKGNFIGMPMGVQCVKSEKCFGNINFKIAKQNEATAFLCFKPLNFQVQIRRKSAKDLF